MSLKSSFFAEKYSSKIHKILCEIELQKTIKEGPLPLKPIQKNLPLKVFASTRL